ncbi:LOW QUALITY PROTEIN: hypothetical protein PanWU01x14_352820 [Parasponia andersonii]|uniref:Uncharacterized protein n=1 Tax=Parasponia andersonii TaxID=3476 RepID=A0A2P5AA79_PARAD|nr:LOW QUALITY PROTEIN: hypothetical protein PanWU01x14_352820 [Parasponia andersonii]
MHPGYSGAVATTCGRSKLIPLMCGCDLTISDTAPPVPPPTSTNDLRQQPPNPSLYSDRIALMMILAVHSMASLKSLLNSGFSAAKSHIWRPPWAFSKAMPPSLTQRLKQCHGAISHGWFSIRTMGAKVS